MIYLALILHPLEMVSFFEFITKFWVNVHFSRDSGIGILLAYEGVGKLDQDRKECLCLFSIFFSCIASALESLIDCIGVAKLGIFMTYMCIFGNSGISCEFSID